MNALGCATLHNGHPNTTRRRVGRAGFSLLETVGTVALVGTLLSLCAATLNRAYQVHHTTLDAFRELEQLNFWNERFRADAHQSIALELREATMPVPTISPTTVESQQLVLMYAADKTITYSMAEGQLLRIVKRGDKQIAREVLSATPPAEVSWRLDQSGQYQLIYLQMVFVAPDSARQPLTWTARLLNHKPGGRGNESQ